MKSILIGYGYWGRILEKYIVQSNMFELVGIYSPSKNKETLDEFLNNHNAECAFVCTPLKTHYEIVKRLLAHDMHVFCEKPLCQSFVETEELLRFACEKKRILYTDYVYLSSPSIKKMKEHLQEFGDITYIEMSIKQYGRFYDNESVYEVLGVHMFAVLFFLLDFKTADDYIIKSKNNIFFDENIDASSLFLQCNKSQIKIECSLRSLWKERIISIHCTNGILYFNMLANNTLVGYMVTDSNEITELFSYSFDETNNLKYMLDYFETAIRENNIEKHQYIVLSIAKLLEKILT